MIINYLEIDKATFIGNEIGKYRVGTVQCPWCDALVVRTLLNLHVERLHIVIYKPRIFNEPD